MRAALQMEAALSNQLDELHAQEQELVAQLAACHHKLQADYQVRLSAQFPLGSCQGQQGPCLQQPT